MKYEYDTIFTEAHGFILLLLVSSRDVVDGNMFLSQQGCSPSLAISWSFPDAISERRMIRMCQVPGEKQNDVMTSRGYLER